MGIERVGYSFNVHESKVLDIGGGPVSMLLKCKNLKEGKVYDPLIFPKWVYDRYAIKNIKTNTSDGEDVDETGWDEVWIYNCLQHTKDPYKIIKNALKAANTLRIFEWIDIPPHEGHPQMLTKELLDKWIDNPGNTIELSENGCHGTAYYQYVTK
jgi:hypothetical protein